MKLVKKPFLVLSQNRTITEVLLNDHAQQVLYVLSAAQDLDSLLVEIERVTAPPGKVASGITRAMMTSIVGQNPAARGHGASWVYRPSSYGLIDNRSFFLKIEKRTPIANGSGNGSSPGAGNTWTDATKDFDALGVVAGDILSVTSGALAGDYTIAAALNANLTTVQPFAGAGNGSYVIHRPDAYYDAWFLIPAPYWDHGHPPIAFEGTAPQAAAQADGRLVVFPKRTGQIFIYNTDPANSLVVALDDDGPELTIASGEARTEIEVSTHLMTFRSPDIGGAKFKLIARGLSF